MERKTGKARGEKNAIARPIEIEISLARELARLRMIRDYCSLLGRVATVERLKLKSLIAALTSMCARLRVVD